MLESTERAHAAAARPPTHLPVLDGIRGLAILLVFMAHFAAWDAHSRLETAIHLVTLTGWVGVDLFFVLSGFLITRILLRARGGPRYFVNFYGRRVLRIFPLYYAALFVLLVLGPALSASWRETVSDHANPYVWVYLQNITFWRNGSFRVLPDPGPGLGHLWSLAVEEQFYFVWPFVVWLLPRRALACLCVASFAVAVALRSHLLGAGWYGIYLYCFSPVRVDTLLLGALIAIVAESIGFVPVVVRTARIGFVVFALALLRVAIHDTSLFNYGAWTMRFGYELIALFWGSFLIVMITAPKGALSSRLFSSAPMRTLGKYSYGMYVLHLPLREFVLDPLGVLGWLQRVAGNVAGNLAYIALALTLTFAAAVASYELFEVKFLRLKRFFEYTSRSKVPEIAPPYALE